MASFMKSFGKSVKRTTHNISVSVGRSSATSDPEFNKQRDEFKRYTNQLKKIKATSQRYVSSIQAMHKAHIQLCTEFTKLYNDFPPVTTNDMSQEAAQIKTISEQLQTSKNKVMVEQLNTVFIQPIDRYLKELHDIDKRIEDRRLKAVDMDRYNKRFQHTDPQRNAEEHRQAQQKVQETSDLYNQVNQSLMQDLPHIITSRSGMLNPLMAAITETQQEYFKTSSDIMATLAQSFSSVDSSAAQVYSPLENLPSFGSAGYTSTSSSSTTSTPTSTNTSSNPQSSYGAAPTPAPYGGRGAAPTPQRGGYGAAPRGRGGYGAAPQRGGYGAAPQRGGYGAAPRGRGGYGAAPRGRGGPPQRAAPIPGRAAPTRTVTALYDFQAEDSNELGFQAGAVITVIKGNPGEEWWEGSIGSRRGLFPSAYTK